MLKERCTLCWTKTHVIFLCFYFIFVSVPSQLLCPFHKFEAGDESRHIVVLSLITGNLIFTAVDYYSKV